MAAMTSFHTEVLPSGECGRCCICSPIAILPQFLIHTTKTF